MRPTDGSVDQVVADGSILLSTVLQETYTSAAQKLWSSWRSEHVEICAPVLFRYEITATVRKSVFRGLLAEDEANKLHQQLLSESIRFVIDDSLLRDAYDIATQLNRPTAYDAQYLALARRLGCACWTTDERLVNAAQPTYAWVQWVAARPPETVLSRQNPLYRPHN